MNLDQLFDAYNITIDKDNIKMIRHVPGDEKNWELIKRGYFEEYQAVQRREDVINRDYILSFIADEYDRTIFKGFYNVKDKKVLEHGDLSEECEITWGNKRDLFFYKIEKLDLLGDLVDRLIIDWGEGKRKWDQNYHNREILAILPKGFLEIFPGYLDFSLEWNQLTRIISEPNSNRDWYVSLSNIYGIYLILDEISGLQYVGSAYGENGIWGRWQTYINTKTGNNKLLEKLLLEHSDRYLHFKFSLLEVLPNTLTRDEVIKREKLNKIKLGSRAFGLNLN
jgi:hypothetical protein